MRYSLPTQHVLNFGIQAKKGKLDASGQTKTGNANMAEILNQALMMLAHEIFDPEINRRVLVDHAFIVAWARSPSRRATGLATRWTRPSAARSCSWTETTS